MALVRNFGAVIIKPLSLINGLAVYLPPQAESALLQSAEILRIDDDLAVNAIGKLPSSPQLAEELP